MTRKIEKTDAEWRAQLSPDEYQVTRQKGTERAFTGRLADNKEKGLYCCICCGKPFEPQRPGGSMDAGHYMSRGSSCQLRFDEANVHGQRKNCNRPGGTTYAAFRAGVVARIGEERTAAVEAANYSHKWTHDELIEIRARYIAKRKALENA